MMKSFGLAKFSKKTNPILFAFVSIFIFGATSCSRERTTLHIYSIIHDEETKALTDMFTEKTGIKTEYLRATTGELVNRVISEKENPNADLLLGGASSYHIQADKAGALETYDSPLAKNVPPYARSQDGTWTGFCVLTLGIGINQTRFAEKFPETEFPKTWDDLLNPNFKGEIVMTNPTASSTAYLFVQNQLQRLGWDKGWEYLLTLAPLVGQFPDSGSAPPRLLGTGEYAIGVAYIHAIIKYRSDGFELLAIAPPDSVGDVDCVSIMKNAKNLDAAKQFVDFMLSKEAQELMSSIDYTIPVNPEARGAEGSVPISELILIDYDVEKAAAQKDEVLRLWQSEVK